MKSLIRSALLILLTCLLMAVPAHAEDIAMVNRPVNTSGLTGILLTTAPYTLAPGAIELAASVLSENSITPDYTITEYPLSVTVGMSHNAELGVRGSYSHIKEGASATAPTLRKTGDLEILYKWNFLPQAEDSIRPAFSLITGGGIPTGNNEDMKISALNHWGLMLGISAGTEIGWGDHVLGIYADANVKGSDPTEKRLRDIYEVVNAGLLFPISKYRNLQMLFEYTMVHGRERIARDGGDYSALNYGLRLVNEQFNLTVGTQFLRKQTEGYENSDRVIGLMSMKF